MTFGERLKMLRAEKGKTLETVGSAVGVTRQYLSNVEHDYKTPGKNVIGALADYFGVTVDYMMGKTDIRNSYGYDSVYQKGYEDGSRCMDAMDKIPLYDPISCGTGAWVDEIPSEFVGLPDGYLKTSLPLFANEADGDSMMPTIHPDDLLIFGKTEDLDSGQIGAFSFNGEYYCKRFRRSGGQIWLHSDNPAYDPILVTADDEFRILGVLKARVSKCR